MTRHSNGSPSMLLDSLEPFLGQSGCLKSSKDMQKFLEAMKESKMMVSRCLILNILKSTRAPSILQKFVDSEGWNLLNRWLADYKRTQNVAFILEMLEVLQKLPVTVSTLKSVNSTMGKLVKQLSKHESSEVRSSATELLSSWMSLFGKSKGPAAETSEIGSVSKATASLGASTEVSESRSASKPPPEESKSVHGPSKSKKRKEEKPPIEATPPGPLVALGQPKPHSLKRPRDIALGQMSAKQLTSPPSSATEEKGSPLSSPALKIKGPTESLGFMNALSSQAQPQKSRRVKKFVRTLPNIKAARSSRVSSEDDSEQKNRTEDLGSSSSTSGPIKELNEEDEDEGDGPPKPKKKRVSWAPDERLTEIQYFEVDDSERGGRGLGTFLDAAVREKLLERQTMEAAKRSNDRMEEQVLWRRPRSIENLIELIPVGSSSDEKTVQAEREQVVLCQLFFNRESLPATPSEPDQPVSKDESEPAQIPLYEPGQEPSSEPELNGPPEHMKEHHLHSYPPAMQMPHPVVRGPPPHNGGMPPGPHFRPQGPPPMQGHMMHGFRGPPGPMGGPPHPGMHPNSHPRPHRPLPHPEDAPPFAWGGGHNRGWNPKPGGGNPQVCRHFIRHGCLRGDACKFLHPKDQAPTPSAS